MQHDSVDQVYDNAHQQIDYKDAIREESVSSERKEEISIKEKPLQETPLDGVIYDNLLLNISKKKYIIDNVNNCYDNQIDKGYDNLSTIRHDTFNAENTSLKSDFKTQDTYCKKVF